MEIYYDLRINPEFFFFQKMPNYCLTSIQNGVWYVCLHYLPVQDRN